MFEHDGRARLWRRRLGTGLLAAVTPAAVVAAVGFASSVTASAAPAATAPHWVETWNASQVQPGGTGVSHTGFRAQTVRQIVHTTIGGTTVRLRLSGLFDTRAVVVAAARVGPVGPSGAVAVAANRPVTVGGKAAFAIPAGGVVFTDPVALRVAPRSDLAVSLFFAAPTGPTTWHPLALTTNEVAGGDQAGSPVLAHATAVSSWFYLSAVNVTAPGGAAGVVAFGASTTDGLGSTPGADERWEDDLYGRFVGAGLGAGHPILNAGISGNRLLSDGGTAGQSGLSRFSRDVIGATGAKVVIVSSFGNNDIGDGDGPDGQPVTADQIISGYRQLIARGHAAGFRVIGSTITPDEGASYYTAAGEAVRRQVNSWVRTSGAFDGTVDFAAAVADPSDPSRLAPAYDSGDHLHPDDAGYRAMARAVDLGLFGSSSTG